nr:upf0641 membrane protein [Quercus suber]
MLQIDPALVLPEWAPPIDLASDFSFHAVPAIALVIDLLFFSPPYTIAFVPAFGLSAVIAFSYWYWVERCYTFNKFYPYPIFAVLDTYQRIGLFAFSALLMALSTAFLIWLYAVVNGKDIKHLGNGRIELKERSGDVKGVKNL